MSIFVTVGTQLAFDRLIDAVDAWASLNPDVQVFAQIGPTLRRPVHLQHVAFMPAQEADRRIRDSEVVVAHAGMGSILTALRYRNPIVVLPRRAALREHRNDHQVATARWLQGRPGISVAWTEGELAPILDRRRDLPTGAGIDDVAHGPLVHRLRDYIRAAKPVQRRAP